MTKIHSSHSHSAPSSPRWASPVTTQKFAPPIPVPENPMNTRKKRNYSQENGNSTLKEKVINLANFLCRKKREEEDQFFDCREYTEDNDNSLTLSATGEDLPEGDLAFTPGSLTLGAVAGPLSPILGPLKTHETEIQWGGYTYLLSQDLPEGSNWENYVALYKKALKEIDRKNDSEIHAGVRNLELIATEDRGIRVQIPNNSPDSSPNQFIDITSAEIIQLSKTLHQANASPALLNNSPEPHSHKELSPVQFSTNNPGQIEYTTRFPIGFTNFSEKDQGNLCYLNSAMTMIAGNPVTRSNFQLHSKAKNTALSQSIQEYSTGQRQESPQPICLEPLREMLKFPSAKQEDAPEALQRLFNAAGFEPSTEKLSLPCKRYTSYQVGSEQREREEDLSYPEIPPVSFASGPDGNKLSSLMYSALHHLSGGATVKESDGKDVNVSEFHIKFDKPPVTLFGQVKRFETDGNKVHSDLEVDLEYTFPSDSSKTAVNAQKYDLVSFIVHKGATRNNGHYVAYLRTFGKNKEDQPIDLFWEINDSQVVRISKKTFLDASKQMYIYNYNRRDITDGLRTSTIIEETPPKAVSNHKKKALTTSA